jgi:hypothetical protein
MLTDPQLATPERAAGWPNRARLTYLNPQPRPIFVQQELYGIVDLTDAAGLPPNTVATTVALARGVEDMIDAAGPRNAEAVAPLLTAVVGLVRRKVEEQADSLRRNPMVSQSPGCLRPPPAGRSVLSSSLDRFYSHLIPRPPACSPPH